MDKPLDANSRRARIMLNVCAIAALAGLIAYLLFNVFFQTRNGRRSTQWPRVPATMISAEAIPTSTRGIYELDVQYSYAVDGTRYEGDRHRFHAMQGNHHECNAIANTLNESNGVVVSYDPDDPSMSVMEPGITFGELAECAIGAILGVVVLSGFLAAFIIDLRKTSRLTCKSRQVTRQQSTEMKNASVLSRAT